MLIPMFKKVQMLITRPQLIEPSQISNEIQAWTENFEQKNNDRLLKMREAR